MQKTLLRSLALKSIAEIGISQWIWEIKSNFEKIREATWIWYWKDREFLVEAGSFHSTNIY